MDSADVNAEGVYQRLLAQYRKDKSQIAALQERLRSRQKEALPRSSTHGAIAV
jgi:hypothetical protein